MLRSERVLYGLLSFIRGAAWMRWQLAKQFGRNGGHLAQRFNDHGRLVVARRDVVEIAMTCVPDALDVRAQCNYHTAWFAQADVHVSRTDRGQILERRV